MAEINDFVPYTLSDVIYPTDNFVVKLNSLIDRSELIIVDLMTDNLNEGILAINQAKTKGKEVIIIVEEGIEIPSSIRDLVNLKRSKNIFTSYDRFLDTMSTLFKDIAKEYVWYSNEETVRLLEYGESRAAFISAIVLLENEVKKYLISKELIKPNSRGSLYNQYKILINNKELNKDELNKFKRWINMRNEVLHANAPITNSMARKYTNEITEFIHKLKQF